jgi:hypothetical protein
MGDDTIFALILAIMAAVVGTRWTSAFGGLGFGTVSVIILWFANYVTTGMLLLAFFMAAFLGLNVASNIDYTVRR